jgi:hypothetical protein
MEMKQRVHQKFGAIRILTARLFFALLCVIAISMSASPVLADILWISPAGVTALQPSGLLKPRPDGKGFYVRGRIVIQRDAADQPTLKFPGKYFMFEPYKSGNTYGPAKQFEWVWVSSVQQETDTLDDLRAILSNRDRRYGTWEAAFKGLIAEIDPEDTIYQARLSGARPPSVTNASIVLREGPLPRDLINGRIPTSDEMKAYNAKLRSRPVADPLSYNPIDSMATTSAPETVISVLIEAIARSEKYGEPEKGFLEAARQVARFICEDLYPPPQALSGPSRDKATFILAYAARARAALFSYASEGNPKRLSSRLSRPGQFDNSLNDKLLFARGYVRVDDALAINILDAARAAVEVMGDLRVSREQDEGRLISELLHVASGRAEFQNLNTSKLPAELQSLEDPIAKLAVETMIKLGTSRADRGAFAAGITEEIVSGSSDAATGAAGVEIISRVAIGKPSDVARLIDSYWEIGLSAINTSDARIDQRSFVARDVLKRTGPVIGDPNLRNLYAQYLSKKIQQFENRQRSGQGSAAEKRWLQLLKS